MGRTGGGKQENLCRHITGEFWVHPKTPLKELWCYLTEEAEEDLIVTQESKCDGGVRYLSTERRRNKEEGYPWGQWLPAHLQHRPGESAWWYESAVLLAGLCLQLRWLEWSGLNNPHWKSPVNSPCPDSMLTNQLGGINLPSYADILTKREYAGKQSFCQFFYNK